MGIKKEKLVLVGNKRYIDHMFKHLRHEHPSTRRRMHLIQMKGGFK